MKHLLLALLAGCATPQTSTPDAPAALPDAAVSGAPSIAILLGSTPPSQSPPDKVIALLINNAQHTWEALGIRAWDRVVPMAECPIPWFDHREALPCAVTIHLSLVATQAELGGSPSTTELATHSSTVALDMPLPVIQSVLAHELGAVMFETTDRLAPGACGIMGISPGVTEPTPADVTFAVAHTHGWVSPSSDSYTTTCQ